MKERFFKLAEKLSEKSDHPTHKHGSVVVRGNRIYGIGFNKAKTSPKSPTAYKMIHAELAAVLSTHMENLSGCDIYVYRKTKNGRIANSFPCHFCFEMLQSLDVRRIYYSHEDNFKVLHLK